MPFTSDGSFYGTPPQPRDVVLRPLSKGMRRDVPPSGMAVGEFYDIQNAQARVNGIERRKALAKFLSENLEAFPFCDRGNCESATAPMISGETSPYLSNALWARDSAQFHSGTYSFKFTKNIAAGTAGWAYLDDKGTSVTNDLHGLPVGSKVRVSAWVYIPTASGILNSEIYLDIADYWGGSWSGTSVQPSAIYDAWQFITVTTTVRSTSTGAYIRFAAASTSALNEYYYVDDITIEKLPVFNFPPFYEMKDGWKTDGTNATLVFDSRQPYYFSPSMAVSKSTYVVGTITATQVGSPQFTRLTGAGGTDWANPLNDIKVGDIVWCNALTGLNKCSWIKAIDSGGTQIDLATDEGTAAAGSSYEIRRGISPQPQHFPIVESIDGVMLICTGRREALKIDISSPGTLNYYSTHVTFDLIPYTVCFFKDRFFFGRTVEAGLDNRNRIRWTTASDLTKLPTLQFVDLPYTLGFIRRLVPLENYLVCYMTDAVWIGRLTNMGDSLPVAFDFRLETGGMGLVGDRAVISFMGGHICILNDNIYFLGSNLQLQPIGDPIKELFFENPDNLWTAQIMVDAVNERVLFTMPASSIGFSRIFIWDYQTKGWSHMEVTGSLLGRSTFTRFFSYDGWLSSAPYTYDTGLGIFPSYDAMGMSAATDMLYVCGDMVIRYFTNSTLDNGTDAIPVVIESGDFDFDTPDEDKTFLRLSVKIRDAIAETIIFNVSISDDSGLTWRLLSGRPLTIDAGTKENFVNFRMKSSIFRYKLESSSICRKYVVQEVVLRAATTGVESHLAANR